MEEIGGIVRGRQGGGNDHAYEEGRGDNFENGYGYICEFGLPRGLENATL